MRVITDYLFRSAQERPDFTALVCGEQRLTYDGLASHATSLAGYLVAHGLEKGDRVVVFLENSPETIVAIFGALYAGGCIVVLNPLMPCERLGRIVDNCVPKFLVGPLSRLGFLQKALERCSLHQPSLILSGEPEREGSAGSLHASLREIIDTAYPDPAVRLQPVDLAAIIYTSGSTGVSKGATFLHGNIDAAVDSVAEYLGHTEQDIVLSVLPLASSYGLLQVLVPFRTGGRVVLERRMPLPYDFLQRIKEEHVTGFAGNPTIHAMLLKLEGGNYEHPSTLRYITNAAAALPATFIPRLLKIFPTAQLYLMHGLTECLRTSYLPPAELYTRSTSIGKGIRNVELWIQDADGHRLGHGEAGEMMVHGPTVMQGYWNDPEATSRALIPGKNQWDNTLHTNDLFRLDNDGYFHFVARSDELIKTRGEKVSPVEVEDVLYEMEAILDVRVFGLPDPVLGNAIKAEIVVKEGCRVTAHQIRAHCRQHLEEYKIPQVIDFVAVIPRTAAGKVQRRISPASASGQPSALAREGPVVSI